jgi:L-alanine-DL-glutamate epimerase-like enolase superfamily enzyme
MYDSFGKYNREQALWLGRRLEELNFLWYEEPTHEWDIEGYAQLCAALDIPILGLESVPGSMFTTPEYILRRAVDMVRSNVTNKGGIGPVKKTASLAEAFGMNCEIHAGMSPLSNAANLHVIGSIKNCTFCELMVPRDTFSAGVIEDVKIDKEGYVKIPNKPGLGLELDWKSINAHKTYETPPLK